MSLIKQLFQPEEKYFTPASQEVNWTRVETLVHGPAAEATKPTYNSAVFACLMAIATAYPEPPLRVYQTDADSNEEKLPEHPLQDLLDKPTPKGELSAEEILFWTAWAKHIDGNAYWLKVRSGNAETGNVVQLWPISPTVIEPATERGSGDWISYYKYRIEPNKTIAVPVENIVHFRLGLDDQDMRRGLSPLKALIRHIATDEEADKFVERLLRNYAIPGLVVIPAQGDILDEEDAMAIRDSLDLKFSGDNRGSTAVMSRDSKIEQFGFSPAELDMSIMHRVPEERISAVMGVPAIVANLGAGLDRATYANFREAREMFTEQKLVPMWRADAGKINASLLVDFTSEKNIHVEFDITNVRALQEDENDKYKRLWEGVRKPFITQNEARSDIGLPQIEGGDDLTTAQPGFGNMFGADDNEPENEENEEDKARLIIWRRWALSRIGDNMDGFDTSGMTPALAGWVSAQLSKARTADDVKAVFEKALRNPPDVVARSRYERRVTRMMEQYFDEQMGRIEDGLIEAGVEELIEGVNGPTG
jgi:HK97 family phage portal protein